MRLELLLHTTPSNTDQTMCAIKFVVATSYKFIVGWDGKGGGEGGTMESSEMMKVLFLTTSLDKKLILPTF